MCGCILTGSPEKTTPWERQKETYTVYFPLHELYNDFSKKDILAAEMVLQFKGKFKHIFLSMLCLCGSESGFVLD